MREYIEKLLSGDFVLGLGDYRKNLGRHGPGVKRATRRRDEGRSKYAPHQGVREKDRRSGTAS